MKKKVIIRINRDNKINWGGAFLIIYQFILLLLALIAQDIFYILLVLILCLIVLFVALLYQGFEVIQE